MEPVGLFLPLTHFTLRWDNHLLMHNHCINMWVVFNHPSLCHKANEHVITSALSFTVEIRVLSLLYLFILCLSCSSLLLCFVIALKPQLHVSAESSLSTTSNFPIRREAVWCAAPQIMSLPCALNNFTSRFTSKQEAEETSCESSDLSDSLKSIDRNVCEAWRDRFMQIGWKWSDLFISHRLSSGCKTLGPAWTAITDSSAVRCRGGNRTDRVCLWAWTRAVAAAASNFTLLDILCTNYRQRHSAGVLDNAEDYLANPWAPADFY